MYNCKEFFRNKKITMIGLGLLGRGVGDAQVLAECGAELTITDLKSSGELKDSLKKLNKFKNIKYVLGRHDLKDFQDCDMVLKAAGVPLDSIYIKEAEKNRIPVEMSATLFARFSGITMIGVTGTRGKTTVAHMVAHILKQSGKDVILGGNIRGVSNLALLNKVKKNSIAVFELDSWQLQGFGENKISPHIAVFTTFYPDHMVYYGGNMKKYFTDKSFIFKYQRADDLLVVGEQVVPFIKKWGGTIKSRMMIPKNQKVKVGIPGEHNVYNGALALEAVRGAGIKSAIAIKALEGFSGVEGRMEYVREQGGVKYYNDTTATTPEATLAALKTLGKNIILIAGGSDKKLNMNALIKEIPKYCKGVILLSGSGTDKIKNKIENAVEADSMKGAVMMARATALRGDTVLLSPGFASFGMFKNEYDRGDQFVKIVKSLK